ncbi:MAG: site-specific integrase [Xanthobacteraceae bacterium]
MIDDMSLRNMAALTQAAYIRAVKNFSKHFGKSPDKLTFEDVRQYQLSLVGRGLGPQAVNQIMCALRFFYKTTMGIMDAHDHIPLARRSDPLPAILSREEVGRFLQAAHNVKYRTIFATIYAAGLRVSELISLTVKDIDSARMVIHVRQGKGRKDRYVMLSDQLLDLLRSYWKIDRPSHWLFPGTDPQRHITARALERVCRQTADAAGIGKNVTVHTLRHCFATHLLEQGVDIRVIQDLLGHRHLNATARYARVAINTIRQIQSPLELLKVQATPPT